MTQVAEPVSAAFAADADYPLLVAKAVRVLYNADVMHMSGHIAVRDAGDPNRFWINSRKASRSTLTAADIVPVDLTTGKRIGSGDEPPSELPIHLAVLRRRPDVQAIVHTHPEHVVALSIVDVPLAPVHLPAGFMPENVPVWDDPSIINSQDRGEVLADHLGNENVLVIRGHGVVVTGSTFEEAVSRTVLVAENARIQCTAMSLGAGKPRTLKGEELRLAAKQMCQPIVMKKHYNYHMETARAHGALDGVEG
jgi:ribulose-5-phosphate 4-epimerase/fuculose-1-phosphate aldolase